MAPHCRESGQSVAVEKFVTHFFGVSGNILILKRGLY